MSWDGIIKQAVSNDDIMNHDVETNYPPLLVSDAPRQNAMMGQFLINLKLCFYGLNSNHF